MLNIDYETADGDLKSIDANTVAGQLKEAGHDVSLSPDGTKMFLHSLDGNLAEANINDLISENYGKVRNIKPTNADYSNVSPLLRLQLEALPNDLQTRKAFLASQLSQTEGLKDVTPEQIMGSGDDFYVFNKHTGKHYAITNKPGMDMSDVAGFLPSLGRSAVSAAGGLLAAGGAAATGPGAIAAGAAGGAGAGLAASKVGQYVTGKLNPNFKSAMDGYYQRNSIGNIVADEALDAAGDAVGGGLTPGLNTIGKKFASQGLKGLAGATKTLTTAVNPQIASRSAQAVGGVAEPVGSLVAGASKMTANSPFARNVLQTMNPVTGGNELLLQGAKLPVYLKNKGKQAVGGIAKYFGEDDLAKAMAKPSKPFVNTTQGFGDEIAQTLTKQPRQSMKSTAMHEIRPDETGNFYANIAENLGNKIQKFKNKTVTQVYDTPDGKKIRNVLLLDDANKTAAKSFETINHRRAAKIGKSIENFTKFGEKADEFSNAMVGAGLRTTQGIGNVAKYSGRALNQTSKAFAPLEGRIAQQKVVNNLAQQNNEPGFLEKKLAELKLKLMNQENKQAFNN